MESKLLKTEGNLNYYLYSFMTYEQEKDRKPKVFSNPTINKTILYEGRFRDSGVVEKIKEVTGLKSLESLSFNTLTDYLILTKEERFILKEPTKQEEVKEISKQRNRRFTPEEDVLLFQGKPKEVAIVLNRNVKEITARKANIKKRDINYYNKLISGNEINVSLKSTNNTVTKSVKLNSNKRFTKEEDLILFTFSPSVASQKLNRELHSIYCRKNQIKSTNPVYYQDLINKAKKLKPLETIQNTFLEKSKEFLNTHKIKVEETETKIENTKIENVVKTFNERKRNFEFSFNGVKLVFAYAPSNIQILNNDTIFIS